MSLDGVVDVLDGKIVVRTEWCHYTEPTRVKQYWPVFTNGLTVDDARERGIVGLTARHFSGPSWGFGVYSRVSGHQLLTLLSPNGGKTECVKVEREPIPAPKTKLETRWYQGAWQKLTKRGWVAA